MIEVITDEDNLYLFMLYGGGKPVDQSPSRPVFRNNRTAGGRNMWVNEPRKRTTAEAKKRLEWASIPFRILTPIVPPIARPILGGTPRLAEFFIDVDPLDRLED